MATRSDFWVVYNELADGGVCVALAANLGTSEDILQDRISNVRTDARM